MAHATKEPTPLPPNHHADHAGFSGIAGWVAAMGFRIGRSDDAALAVALTRLAADERVVDIGCGPGVAARHAATVGAIVTGVDPAEVMLAVARKDDRRSTVTWLPGTAESLPLPDESCDVAWSLATVHHWRDLDRGLAEVCRVLAPGGRFLAIERRVKAGAKGHASHGWTDQQADLFASLCRSVGFGEVALTRHNTRRGTLLAVLCRMGAP